MRGISSQRPQGRIEELNDRNADDFELTKACVRDCVVICHGVMENLVS
jgi:hypothetical protein